MASSVTAWGDETAGRRLILRDVGQLVTVAGHSDAPARTGQLGQIGLVEDGWLVVEAGRIAALGPMESYDRAWEAPPAGADEVGVEVLSLPAAVVTPGLVDPHTHALFGGWRADEWSARVGGATYEEIMARGGGILSTVAATRAASDTELTANLGRSLRLMAAAGTTTAEVKSGYGLSTEQELRLLRILRQAADDPSAPVRVVPTFLGAHAIPPERAADRAGYVREITEEMLPAIARQGLSRFCDVFCDEGAFTVAEAEAILCRGNELGLSARLHADELAAVGAAELAARLGARSADHLLRATPTGLQAMARAGVIATLLPGTAFYLGKSYADARLLRDMGLPLALASDYNPGTSVLCDMRLVMTLACTYMGLTPGEALVAATINGAHVLGLAAETGSLEVGKAADLAIWELPDYRHLTYQVGGNPLVRLLRSGRTVFARE